MSKAQLQALISDHEGGKPFTAHELDVSSQDQNLWVRFKSDPQRFLPKIFDGEWAYTQQHPEIGPVRVVRVMTGSDGISRVIARQGNKIYASPWFE